MPTVVSLKQMLVGAVDDVEMMLAQVLAQKRDGAWHQGHESLFASLPGESEMGRCIEARVADSQVDDFLAPRPSVVQHREQDRVAAPTAATAIRAGENRADVFGREIRHRAALVSTRRNREDALCLEDAGWVFRLQVAEEGMERGETLVARARRATAIALDVIEERDNERRVDGVQRDLLGSYAATIAEKSKEQREGVAVRSNGVGADVSLAGEIRGEKARKAICEVGRLHVICSWRGIHLPISSSMREARSGNSSGVSRR